MHQHILNIYINNKVIHVFTEESQSTDHLIPMYSHRKQDLATIPLNHQAHMLLMKKIRCFENHH